MAKKKRSYLKEDGKSAKKPKLFDKCYICERVVGSTGQRDHFPVSHAEGGETVMTICEPCHTLKDRIALDNWDPDAAFNALMGLWIKSLPEERLWLTKIFHIASMQSATIAHLANGDQNFVDAEPKMVQDSLTTEAANA